jgi:hypothetical protein
MIGDTADTITWRGEITLLQRDTKGWRVHPYPLRLIEYRVARGHRL